MLQEHTQQVRSKVAKLITRANQIYRITLPTIISDLTCKVGQRV